MFRRVIVLGWLCILTAVSYAQRINEILSDLAAPAQQSVLVVSHRGDWRNAPENSLQAFQNCIDMGVDMVELDLKKTKDGELILMHGKPKTLHKQQFPAVIVCLCLAQPQVCFP